MKKVLMVATLASMIDLFNRDNLKILQSLGCEVTVLANFQFGNGTSLERVIRFKRELQEMGIKVIDVAIDRKPICKANIQAYKQIKEIMNVEQYDLIHCQSPQGGALGRLAAKNTRKSNRTQVIYAAHGFHFLKGASYKSWLIYFPVEWFLSKFCDVLITINSEDEQIAKKYFMTKRIERISGAGISIQKFTQTSDEIRSRIRLEMGYSEQDFILLSVGELVNNKHQDLLINVINQLKGEIPNIRLLLAGQGQETETFKALVNSLELNQYIEFLGFRNDVVELMKMCDVAVSASKREGLPINIMEAMATGIPVVATNCRGNRDLIIDGQNGYLIEQEDVLSFSKKIMQLYNNQDERNIMGKEGRLLVMPFSSEIVNQEMTKIYVECLHLGGNSNL